MSLACAIPFFGDFADAGKIAKDAVDIEKDAKSIYEIGEEAESIFNGVGNPEVRYKVGNKVEPMEKTYDMALDPEYYANEVAKKYGINLKGSGQKIEIKFNPDLKCAGKSRKATPNIIEIGPSALAIEDELANTIAHELNHARSWLKGGNAPEETAYPAGDALSDYINGGR